MVIQGNDQTGRNPITRRRLLAGAGGVLTAGTLAGHGGIAGAAGARQASARRAAARAAMARWLRSGDLPALSQWYHEYGEAGTLDAVTGYAADYPDAAVEIQWIPGDYDGALASALLTDEGPDVFEVANGPNIDMIQSGQVVPLDGILGDAEDDFNERVIKRLTYDGHLWAVPQNIDMQFLVYRKSWFEDAGLEVPTTLDDLIAAADALTNDDHSGLFLGNDGGIGLLGGPALWSAGADYLTADGEFGFATDAVYESFAKIAELYQSNSILLGAPTEWSDPGAFVSELCAIQFTGLWTLRTIMDSDIGDDFDVMAWPALSSSTGEASVPIGSFSSAVSAGTVDADVAKAFVEWLWVDQTDKQLDFALSYGLHIPVRTSLAEGADELADGPPANAMKLAQDNGFTQTPILWTPAANNAYSDARNRIIADGADPAEEIAALKDVVDTELERVGSGSSPSASSAPVGSSAPSNSDASATTEAVTATTSG